MSRLPLRARELSLLCQPVSYESEKNIRPIRKKMALNLQPLYSILIERYNKHLSYLPRRCSFGQPPGRSTTRADATLSFPSKCFRRTGTVSSVGDQCHRLFVQPFARTWVEYVHQATNNIHRNQFSIITCPTGIHSLFVNEHLNVGDNLQVL